MKNLFRHFFIISLIIQVTACDSSSESGKSVENDTQWWDSVKPVNIGTDRYYGRPCSVTRVRNQVATVIFEAPIKWLTSCSSGIPYVNYLKYDGEYITLHVDRQAFGAGAKTGERFRTSNFNASRSSDWEEYIGITWVNNEEYEAWRKLGSNSKSADSRKKVIR